MNLDFDRFIAAFEAAGHAPYRDADGDYDANDEYYDEDGCPSNHPMVRCIKCCYAVCWMCVECGRETIEPCKEKDHG